MKRAAQALVDRMTALEEFLVRTDSLTTGGVPTREQRAALIGPTLDALLALGVRPRRLGHYLARRATPPRRTRQLTIPTKETTPMTDAHFHPGQVIDEPAEETARRAQADAERAANGGPPDIPEALYPFLASFDRLFRTPSAQPHAMLVHEANRLARAIVNCPPRELTGILTRILFRLAMKGAR